MSERLRQVSASQLLRALEQLGFVLRRQTGSHCILRHKLTHCIISIPMHSGDIKRGLLFGILKQARVSKKEFEEAIRY